MMDCSLLNKFTLGRGWARKETSFGVLMERKEAEFHLDIKKENISLKSRYWLTLKMYCSLKVSPKIILSVNNIACTSIFNSKSYDDIWPGVCSFHLKCLVPAKQLTMTQNKFNLCYENFKESRLSLKSVFLDPVFSIQNLGLPVSNYGDEERKAIFIPKNDRYRFQADLRKATHMNFGYAQFPGANRPLIEVRLNDTREKPLLWKIPFQSDVTQGWQDVEMDFSSLPRAKFEFELQVKETGDECAFVSVPTFYEHRRYSKKNVILVCLDTLRADHLSAYGYERKTSPCLDDIAKRSVLFKWAFAPASWTIPSHVSLFTGLYASKLLDTHEPCSSFAYREKLSSATTLASVFQANDYLTAAFTGSCGVDSTLGFSNGFMQYTNLPPWDNSGCDKTEDIFRLGIDWIEKYHKSNFFVFLHTYETHQPHLHRYFAKDLKKGGRIACQRYMKEPPLPFVPTSEEINFAIDLYDSSIYHVDRYLGILIEKLESLKILNDTIIIILSDHGEEIWDHSRWDHGRDMHEEILHVPLIFYNFPGNKPIMIHEEVSLVDIFPTLVEALNLRTNSDQNSVDGISLVSCLKGRPANRKIIFSECVTPAEQLHRTAIRKENFKYTADRKISSPLSSVMNESLYSLKEDPGEKKNLAHNLPELLQSFRNIYMHFILSLGRQRLSTFNLNQPYSRADELRIIQRLKVMGYL